MTEQAVLLELPRRCTRCKELKPVTEFTWEKRQRYLNNCKKCMSEKTLIWRGNNRHRIKEHDRKIHIKTKYKISMETFDILCAVQGNRCGICRRDLPIAEKKWREVCVDHDHLTGKIRGILCRNCNTGVGHLQDNPDLLQAASLYVRKHRVS